MSHTDRRRRPPPRERGIALLMVVTAIAIMSIIALEFGNSSRTHLNQGVNLRDDIRASTLADTALVLTRACLDRKAWGPAASFLHTLNLERVCNMMLGIFLSGRVDMPVGGLSIELEGIEGVGMARGELESLTLKAEESFVGLGGLQCPMANINCGTRQAAVHKLRSLLCDPEIADVFEKEQADGHRYTREEVIGNLIDWVDADDNRITFDQLQENRLIEGAGEGEDAYLRDGDERYRSKDAPFDSVQELRMIRGINDTLFEFMQDKVSVHAMGKINVETAGADVITTLLRAHSPYFRIIDRGFCGEENETNDQYRRSLSGYARLIVDAREMKKMQPWAFMTPAFKTPKHFTALARDPLQHLFDYQGNMGMMSTGGPPIDMVLARYGMYGGEYEYMAVREAIDWNGLASSITNKTDMYRLEATARLGNMTRRVFAIVKLDGAIVRTVYYREE